MRLARRRATSLMKMVVGGGERAEGVGEDRSHMAEGSEAMSGWGILSRYFGGTRSADARGVG